MEKYLTIIKNKCFQKEHYNGMNIYKVKAVTGYKNKFVQKLLKYFLYDIREYS